MLLIPQLLIVLDLGLVVEGFELAVFFETVESVGYVFDVVNDDFAIGMVYLYRM